MDDLYTLYPSISKGLPDPELCTKVDMKFWPPASTTVNKGSLALYIIYWYSPLVWVCEMFWLLGFEVPL